VLGRAGLVARVHLVEFRGVFVDVGFGAVGVGPLRDGFHEETARLLARGVVAVGVGGPPGLGGGAGGTYSGFGRGILGRLVEIEIEIERFGLVGLRLGGVELVGLVGEGRRIGRWRGGGLRERWAHWILVRRRCGREHVAVDWWF